MAEIGRRDGESSLAHAIVTGGGGARLHVVETGNPTGRPIVFIHGFSQSWLSWGRQLRSDLAEDYRLIAMDMRGHGLSEKPLHGYADSTLWAADLHAVIQSFDLQEPVLCGWSYGPLVILDYLRCHGDEGIGGVNFVSGITELGGARAMAALLPEFLNLVPGLLANEATESARSLETLARMCFTHEPSPDELCRMLEYSVAVPAHVRQALFSRSFDNDDLLPKIRKPVLLTHGLDDRIVDPAVVKQHTAAMAHAQIHMMTNAGHAPFWDDAPAFNQRLRAFLENRRDDETGELPAHATMGVQRAG
jgi:pimeloyl-ACP methyl ester carboxylesterase